MNPKSYTAELGVKPTLKTLEPHVLRALIAEDLRAYLRSLISNVHCRLADLSKSDI